MGQFKRILQNNYQQILLVCLAFLAMVMVSFFYISRIVRQQMQNLGDEVMNTTQTAVTGALAETELIFDSVLQNLQHIVDVQGDNKAILTLLEETDLYLRGEGSPLPDFLNVYGFFQGVFLNGSGWVPPEDYYPPRRPWYIGAMQNKGKRSFSEPYVDADTGDMCISFSQLLFYPDGAAAGVIAIDLSLNRITEYVAQQRIAELGYGIMISDSFHITTHENPEYIGLQLQDVSREYGRIEEMLASQENASAVHFKDYDGTASIGYFRKIFNGWYIGIFTPRQNFYAQVYEMGVVLALLGLLLMVALSALLVRTHMEKLRADAESKSKSSFLARMSHEMRTPMNAIIGMTNIARNTEDLGKIKESLEKVNDAADHLLGVINDVLDMSKIEANKLELSLSDYPIANMLQKIMNVMEYKFRERNQQFRTEISPDLPAAIVADEQRLVQVIVNLLSNANKFTAEGGEITLRIRCKERDDAQCLLEIEVEDNGIGMSPGQQSRLFRPFEQADNSISREYGGTGLGLAISQRIVQMMEGEIGLRSQLGEGSTFYFTARVGIGQDTGSTLDAENLEERTKGLFAGHRILLAEDILINQEILLALLADTGLEIDCAGDGEAALAAFAAAPEGYELVFMDIHMPKMDGYDTARAIRALDIPWAKEIPIIAMTADVFKEDVDQAENAGMNGHVGKPIDLDEVLTVLLRYISLKG